MKDFIISYVSHLSVKRPSCWTKKQKKPPERCNVRSLMSVMNNASISNDRLRNRIINLIKLTEGGCVVFGGQPESSFLFQ